MTKLRVSAPAQRAFIELLGQHTCSGSELVTALAERYYTRSLNDTGIVIQLGPRTRDLNFFPTPDAKDKLRKIAHNFLIVPVKATNTYELASCALDAILTDRIVSIDPIEPKNHARLAGVHGIHLSDKAYEHLRQMNPKYGRRISLLLNELAEEGGEYEVVGELQPYPKLDRRLSMDPKTVLFFAELTRVHNLPVSSRRSVISLTSVGIEAVGQGVLARIE